MKVIKWFFPRGQQQTSENDRILWDVECYESHHCFFLIHIIHSCYAICLVWSSRLLGAVTQVALWNAKYRIWSSWTLCNWQPCTLLKCVYLSVIHSADDKILYIFLSSFGHVFVFLFQAKLKTDVPFDLSTYTKISILIIGIVSRCMFLYTFFFQEFVRSCEISVEN